MLFFFFPFSNATNIIHNYNTADLICGNEMPPTENVQKTYSQEQLVVIKVEQIVV